MRFSSDGFSADDAGCAAIGPYDGKRDDDEQGRELVGIGDMGVFGTILNFVLWRGNCS